MEARIIGPGFAAEVTGIDPALPPSEAAAEELRGLLDAHQLLVFRAPGLDTAAQLRFLSAFGAIFDEAGDGSGYSLVSNVAGFFPNGRLLFHQDFGFTPIPHPVQSLYGEEVLGGVAATKFVSNIIGYSQLDAAQQSAWADLSAVHARNATRSGNRDDEFTRVRLHDLPDSDNVVSYPRATHRLLQRHPRSGRPLLFATEYHTSHIEGMEANAGEAVLQAAFRALYRPENIYAHEWRAGDLVIWDNIALQHARAPVLPDTRRTLRRVIVNAAAALAMAG